jgi:hypothetical protein
VTFFPTVIVDGELWASKKAPGATFRFPTMLIDPLPSAGTWQKPVTVTLA